MTEDFINGKTIERLDDPCGGGLQRLAPHVVSKNTRNFRVSTMARGRF
jgi:hypothetical protein